MYKDCTVSIFFQPSNIFTEIFLLIYLFRKEIALLSVVIAIGINVAARFLKKKLAVISVSSNPWKCNRNYLHEVFHGLGLVNWLYKDSEHRAQVVNGLLLNFFFSLSSHSWSR